MQAQPPQPTIDPCIGKLDESLSKIEHGIRQLQASGGPVQLGLSLVTSGAANLRRMVTKAREIEQLQTKPMNSTLLDLERLADQAIDSAKASLGFTGIISVGKLGIVRADRILLLAALRELVLNAMRFSNGIANARVDVETFVEGTQKIIVVRDNGIGFHQPDAGHLFQPYATLHRGSPRAGVGLGLVLVRVVAERHKGRVWARGAPEGHTEFFMSLPSR